LAVRFKNPGVAAVLSFVLPGLGQALGGKPTRGAIIALPSIAFFFAFLPAYLFANASLVGSSSGLTSLAVADALGCLYHVWAIVDAYREVKPPYVQRGMRGIPNRRSTIPLEFATLVALVAATVGVHAFVGAVDVNSCPMDNHSCRPAELQVAAGGGDGAATGQPSLGPSQTAALVDPGASAAAAPTPSAASGGSWMAVADRIRVHSQPGVEYPVTGQINEGDTIGGSIVAGSSYSVAGSTRTDWIEIANGPLTGGYAAAVYFLPGASATPGPGAGSPAPEPSFESPPTETTSPGG
jgi:hypothetical protein